MDVNLLRKIDRNEIDSADFDNFEFILLERVRYQIFFFFTFDEVIVFIRMSKLKEMGGLILHQKV